MSREGVLELRSGPEGKDAVLIVSPALLAEPSTISLPEPPSQPGLLLPDGSINWSCPCLGGMAAGPCGGQFREAFSCFHYSEAEPKGSECFEKFSVMQDCMSRYPELYGRDEEEGAAPEGGEALAAAAGDAGASAGDAGIAGSDAAHSPQAKPAD